MSIVSIRSSPPLALWAEIVPNVPLMTVDELEAMPDDGLT